MANARNLCRGHKQLLPLVEYALKEGWTVNRTPGGTCGSSSPACLRSSPVRPSAITVVDAMPKPC